MKKILISSCLLGNAVRYDGKSKHLDHALIDKWRSQGRLVTVCPEVSGGLPIPRLPAEISNGDVRDSRGNGLNKEFNKGANIALEICSKYDISLAILKENSPSCGSSHIYDGSFTGRVVTGEGITTKLLRKHGIQVFNETQLNLVESLLANELD